MYKDANIVRQDTNKYNYEIFVPYNVEASATSKKVREQNRQATKKCRS